MGQHYIGMFSWWLVNVNHMDNYRKEILAVVYYGSIVNSRSKNSADDNFRGLDTLSRVSPFSTRKTTYVTSCLLSSTHIPSWKDVHSKRKDFALRAFTVLYAITLVLLIPDIPCLCKQCRSRSVGFLRTNWSGSTLFVIENVNLYQEPGSSNLIGWKLEVGMAS